MLINEIFRDAGQPTITYVERNSGIHEKSLTAGIRSNGQLCLLTGPSKTGKTTLYKKVLATLGLTPLIVRCNDQLTAEEVWRSALEGAGVTRLVQTEVASGSELEISAKTQVEGGWKWIARIMGEAGLTTKFDGTDTEIREQVIAMASPVHLMSVLRVGYQLVLEDFHYLNSNTKTTLFQQWKYFVDEGISVIVVGTTHHAADLAQANKDLLGRIRQIEVEQWPENDLQQIVYKGFGFLGVRIENHIAKFIAAESVGLPIITQQVCNQLFEDKGIFDANDSGQLLPINRLNVAASLNNVALHRYGQLERYYNIITTGPRKKARKYETYELVLSCFTLDPLKFCLGRDEIDDRLRKLPASQDDITIPPTASINAMLGVVGRFQKAKSIELLEWRADDRMFYILEPAFLFFLRWRVVRHGANVRNALEELWFAVRRSQFQRSTDGQLTLDFITENDAITDKKIFIHETGVGGMGNRAALDTIKWSIRTKTK